eukprot:IDg3672t1
MRLVSSVLFLLALISSIKLAASSWLNNHFFALSDKAPIARELNKNEKGKQALRNLLNYYTTLQVKMKKLRKPNRKLHQGVIPDLLELYGWPPLSKLVKRVYEVEEPVTG